MVFVLGSSVFVLGEPENEVEVGIDCTANVER